MPVKFTAPVFSGGAFANRLTQAFVSLRESLKLAASAADIIGRAGEGNTSPLVFEEIDGRDHLFRAVEGNESLEVLPSDYENNAQDHWLMFDSGGWHDYSQGLAHLYREGMFILVRVSEGQYKGFVVGANATVALLRINPTSPTIEAANAVFIPVTIS